jgi:hypothetical protein
MEQRRAAGALGPPAIVMRTAWGVAGGPSIFRIDHFLGKEAIMNIL